MLARRRLNTKPLTKQAAYSLIELVITLVILSIVAVFVQSKLPSSDRFKEETFAAQIISSARLAQQLSMNDSARSFVLAIQSDQIDLTEDGSSMSIGALNFPLLANNGITLAPITDITFDSRGETAEVTVTVTAETTQPICFETSGYIHRC
jgi:prepilin-type N-terminal cleavage/methylation domain-containing protein